MAAKRKKKVKPKAVAKRQIRAGRVIESLVLCEQIRAEANSKKLFFIGVYNSNTVRLLAPPPPNLEETPIVLPLAFFVQYRPQESKVARVMIEDPAGTRVYMANSDLVHDQGDAYGALTITGGMVRVQILGEYKLVMEYDGKRDKRPFMITVSEDVPTPS